MNRPPPNFTLFPYTTLFRSQQMAEAVHVDVDDGCGEQCQHLRHQEAADDRIAERLANFRADAGAEHQWDAAEQDRKSTRLNSSHLVISYAVFCLKKKKTKLE